LLKQPDDDISWEIWASGPEKGRELLETLEEQQLAEKQRWWRWICR
jgi:hypothetical protein